MSGEGGVRRRGRAEIERLVDLYRASGMGRKDFCRSHGLGLSTLNRHLKQQQTRQSVIEDTKPHRLVAVEVATVASAKEVEAVGVLTVLLSNRRRVEVHRGFDEETLRQLVIVLERL
jgi:transposase-like protein